MKDNNQTKSGPLSPEEWLAGWNKEKYGDEFPAGVIPAYSMEEMVSMLEEYAAHVARLENRDVRHRAAEIVAEYQGNGLTFLVNDIHRDIMNIPFPARPDGEKQKQDRKHNCYTCRHRRQVIGSAHSACALIGGLNNIESLACAIAIVTPCGIEVNEHGRRNGWVTWPINFDPIWIEKCDFYAAKEEPPC